MKTRQFVLTIILMVLATAVLVGCGGADIDDVSEPDSATGSKTAVQATPPPPEAGAKVEVTRITTDAVVEVTRVVVETAVEEGEPIAGAPVRSADGDFAAESAPDMGGPTDGVAMGGSSIATESVNANSQLNAGEVDDNAQWDDYLLYRRDYNGARVLPIDISERHQIWVQDDQQRPLAGQKVTITADGQEVAVLRTHSSGRIYFFPNAYPIKSTDYQVTVNDQQFTIPMDVSQREWFVTVAQEGEATAVNLDVLFLIDATGSMADEINQLKDNIRAISARIDSLPSQPDVRFGMVAYRDRGDAYVTQVFDFVPDVEAFAADLDTVYADGGGDYPEDLNQGLSDAIHETEWRVDNTVSLIFLVADAPPHLDYGQQNHYAVESLEAAERGIKIYPIASSGLDEQGEYIFRQLAQTTGGRFIFLTYGSGGPGTSGTETEMNVEDYTVSALDDLVIKIVEEELAPLTDE